MVNGPPVTHVHRMDTPARDGPVCCRVRPMSMQCTGPPRDQGTGSVLATGPPMSGRPDSVVRETRVGRSLGSRRNHAIVSRLSDSAPPGPRPRGIAHARRHGRSRPDRREGTCGAFCGARRLGCPSGPPRARSGRLGPSPWLGRACHGSTFWPSASRAEVPGPYPGDRACPKTWR